MERMAPVPQRRSQSETNNRNNVKEKAVPAEQTGADKPRLTEVKSRYLEPKRRPTALKNQTNLPLRPRNISSSDSSRTTSPVVTTRRKDSNSSNAKKPTTIESITMSRDSLASPAKQTKLKKATSGISCNEYEHSIDSLGDDSLRSSLKTNDTKSQESLVQLEVRLAKENGGKPVPAQRATADIINKENVLIITPTEQHSIPARKAVNKKLTTKNLSTCQTNSTNSSPSSVTNKGRLSSTSSFSSPRDNQPKIRSNVVASAAPKSQVRRSFLSARSKEILAKKDSLSLKQSESAKSVPSVIHDKINGSVNKSNSTSNILNRRSNGIPTSTTLHMRRTAKLSISSAASVTSNGSQNSLMNPTKSSSMKVVTQCNKPNKEKVDKKVVDKKLVTKFEQELYDDDKPNDDTLEHVIEPILRGESKLERSSTFCKEVSDLPASELQIIE